jgi:hypothetical protein
MGHIVAGGAVRPEIRALISDIEPDVVLADTDNSYCFTYGPWEFRLAHGARDGWYLDEIVGTGWVHMESMDTNYWWFGFDLGGDKGFHVDIGTKRSPLRVTARGN